MASGSSFDLLDRGSPSGDRAPQAGLFDDAAGHRSWRHRGGLAASDVNRDGAPDLFVPAWQGGTRLYLNRGDGTFEAAGEASGVVRAPAVGVGPWQGLFHDFDRDGRQDLFVAVDFAPDRLLMQGNDGLLDLAATNGFVDTVDPSRFFFNQGGDPVTFREASAEVGFDDLEWGSALAAFDADRDGDLDLVQACMGGPLRLLVNQLVPPGNRYLVVRPRREGRFPIPLGTRVEVEVGGTTFQRLITAGTSFMSQEPAEAFFGLGTAETADRVTVHWPGGGTTTLHDVAADQTLDVTSRIFADGVESGDLGGWSDSQR